jgi:hypothetical protein
MDEREMECKDERIFKNTCSSGKCEEDQKENSSFNNEGGNRRARSWQQQKELPELVDNIIKSNSMTTTTTIDKLFADGGASMKAMRFLGICGR